MLMFGGYGITTTVGTPGYLNDVWQWQWNAAINNGSWSLLYGSTAMNVLSVYSGTVVPGARNGHQMVLDALSPAVFYIYGGYGYANGSYFMFH